MYCHNKRIPDAMISKQQNGGFGLMIWSSVSWCGFGPFVLAEKTMNSQKYVELLKQNVESYISQVELYIHFSTRKHMRPHQSVLNGLHQEADV